ERRVFVEGDEHAFTQVDQGLTSRGRPQDVLLEQLERPLALETVLDPVRANHDEGADRVTRGAHLRRLRGGGRGGDHHPEPEHSDPHSCRDEPHGRWWVRGHRDTTTRIGLLPTATVPTTSLVPVSMTRRSLVASWTTYTRVPSEFAQMPLGRPPTAISSRM